MDRNFFEFWGQLFLSVAKGQSQLEEMNDLFRKGMEGYESMQNIFRTVYGLEVPSSGPDDQQDIWTKAAGNFQESFRQVLSLWGVVLQEDYDALSRKSDELAKKNAEQEQTIHHLQALLGERQGASLSAAKDMQSLLSKQQEEFQTLLNTMGLFLQGRDAKTDKKKR